jgi:hypothetical protein
MIHSRTSVASRAARAAADGSSAYSSDREQSFHAMVNGAWRGQLEIAFLRQVFTIRQALV